MKKRRIEQVNSLLRKYSVADLDELKQAFQNARKGYGRSRQDTQEIDPYITFTRYSSGINDKDEKRLFSKEELREIIDDAFEDFFHALEQARTSPSARTRRHLPGR